MATRIRYRRCLPLTFINIAVLIALATYILHVRSLWEIVRHPSTPSSTAGRNADCSSISTEQIPNSGTDSETDLTPLTVQELKIRQEMGSWIAAFRRQSMLICAPGETMKFDEPTLKCQPRTMVEDSLKAMMLAGYKGVVYKNGNYYRIEIPSFAWSPTKVLLSKMLYFPYLGSYQCERWSGVFKFSPGNDIRYCLGDLLLSAWSFKSGFTGILKDHGLSAYIPASAQADDDSAIAELIATKPNSWYIMKHSYIDRSEGLVMFMNGSSLQESIQKAKTAGTAKRFQVQEYVRDLMVLRDGHRFSIRPWVFIASLYPKILVLYHRGQVYRAVNKYNPDVFDRMAHFTNTFHEDAAIHRRCANGTAMAADGGYFSWMEDTDRYYGLQAVLPKRLGSGWEKNVFMPELKSALRKWTLAVIDRKKVSKTPRKDRMGKSQFFCYDVSITKDGHPFVHELNRGPAMSTMAGEWEYQQKSILIHDLTVSMLEIEERIFYYQRNNFNFDPVSDLQLGDWEVLVNEHA